MKVFLLTISILFAGCMAYCTEGNQIVLRKSDAIGQVIYGKKTYYVVKVADFKKARKGPPTYVGSIENYHLFRVWLKVSPPNEISFFAVRKDDCIIEDEKSPEEEDAIVSSTRQGHRAVEFKNEKCFVKKR